MTQELSSTVQAGNLIRLLGWITLAFSIITGCAVVLLFVVQSEPMQIYVLAIFAAAVLASLAILEVGAAVKKNQPWAKVAGVVVSVISLANIPLGTAIAAQAIAHLVKGWSDNA